jgi:hypothetical protein
LPPDLVAAIETKIVADCTPAARPDHRDVAMPERERRPGQTGRSADSVARRRGIYSIEDAAGQQCVRGLGSSRVSPAAASSSSSALLAAMTSSTVGNAAMSPGAPLSFRSMIDQAMQLGPWRSVELVTTSCYRA